MMGKYLWPMTTDMLAWNAGREAHSADGKTYIRRNTRGPGWLVVVADRELATCETRDVARDLIRSVKPC